MEKKIFQNVYLIMKNHFYHKKNQIRLTKREISQKITEKRQNDGYMTSYVKNGTCYEK